jgi:hypothetical protein
VTRKFDTLQHDIVRVLRDHDPEIVGADTARNTVDLAKKLALHSLDLLKREPWGVKDPMNRKIRFSELGTPCLRQLMYKWYHPAHGNPPYAEPDDQYLPIKFTYGDYIEELVFYLAKEAGHEVTDRQRHLIEGFSTTDWYLEGSMDGRIDGVVVDVKSAADMSYKKYLRTGLYDDTDSFGYRWQLDGYAYAASIPDRAFIFVNKHDGHMHTIDRTDEPYMDLEHRVGLIGRTAETFNALGELPERIEPKVTANGKELPVVCSYCKFKYHCYDGNVDGYIVSSRPVYFVEKTAKGEKFVEGKPAIRKPEAY